MKKLHSLFNARKSLFSSYNNKNKKTKMGYLDFISQALQQVEKPSLTAKILLS